jgi:hypothetical protein
MGGLVTLGIVRLRRMDVIGVCGLLNRATRSRIGAVAGQFGRRVRRLESLPLEVRVGCTVGRGIVP